MAGNIIEFSGVGKRFGGIRALEDVSFSIERGEVHAIVGENGAGKSTLMNILSGMVTPDEGKVLLNGTPVRIDNPTAAQKLGISTVYQELKLCANLNVVQNMFLGRMETRLGLLPCWGRMEARARTLIERLGVPIDVHAPMRGLSVAKMQIIEIAKALSVKANLLILDEPTSSLTILETRLLMRIVRELRESGITVVFISHRLEEVLQIADRITVMRNGRYITTLDSDRTGVPEIVRLIAGKDISASRRTAPADASDSGEVVILEARGLGRGGYFQDVSFSLRRGEILGIYGLQGSGRTELLETLFGLARPDAGEMLVNGRPYRPGSARDAIRRSLGMVSEDRKVFGLFMNFNVWQNIAIIHDRRIASLGVMNRGKIGRMARDYIQRFSIKCSGPEQMVKNLSGGNQQKVVLSKVVSTEPEIILLDEPTRGVDVGTKDEIFRYLERERKENGKSVILVTSELKEVMEECDRVLVMHQNRLAGELRGAAVTEEAVLDLAFNGSGGAGRLADRSEVLQGDDRTAIRRFEW